MKKILIIIDHYIPGYKSGGPLRTISNVVDLLGSKISFYILTRDRDFLDVSPYSNVKVNHWNQVELAKVYYASPKRFKTKLIRQVISDIQPHMIYLNSFFSKISIFFLLYRRLCRSNGKTVILAPRGELSSGALKIRTFKKRFFIFLSRYLFDLYSGVIFHASSDLEKDEILEILGSETEVRVAPDLCPKISDLPTVSNRNLQREKKSGNMVITFCSRINQKKNLKDALRFLAEVNGKVEFNIIGAIGDLKYWKQCQKLISKLPSNVEVKYYGAVVHDEVFRYFLQSHFFILPTWGENFGHVIWEALYCCCPVLISDQTFWKELDSQKLGWVIPISDEKTWKKTLQLCIDMNNDVYQQYAFNTHKFAVQHLTHPQIEQNLNIFN